MTIQGKGLLGAAAVLLGSAAAAIGVTSKDSWNKNNPVAKAWLSENNFSPRDKSKIADFVNNSNNSWFALGCHRILFGGKNFKKLYSENNLTTSDQVTTHTSNTSSLSVSDLFQDINEPLLGCSTAYLTTDGGKKVYQYELALRQGDKGFDERISVHTDKIISQLVFYEKNQQDDPAKKPTYKHLFGLYRYIKPNNGSSSANTYKVANPNPSDSTTDKWVGLDLSNGTNDTQARYYSFWVDDTKGGRGIFDDLGVTLNDKPFSSVSQEKDRSISYTSTFVHTNSMDKDELTSPTSPLTYYGLSALDSLSKRLHDKKGFWKPATDFCSSNETSENTRQPMSEVKRLSQYCYEIKDETIKESKPSTPG